MVIANTPSHVSATLAKATAIAVALSPTAGWSLTADEVWSRMQEIAQSTGADLNSVSREAGPDTLTLNRVVMSSEPRPNAPTKMYMEYMILTEQDDGSVRVYLPESFEVQATEHGIPDVDIFAMRFTLKDLYMIASGDDDALIMSYTAERADLLVGTTGSNQEVPEISGFAEGLDVTTTFSPGISDTSGTAERANLSVEVRDPATLTTMDLLMEFSGIDAASKSPLVNATNFTAENLEEIEFESVFGYQSVSIGVDSSIPDALGAFAMEGGAGRTQLSFSDGILQLDSVGSELFFDLRMVGFPFPFAWSAQEAGIGFAFPVNLPEGSYPYSFTQTLKDLELSPSIWGLFDPNAALPQDPAQLRIDLDGMLAVGAPVLGDLSQGIQTMVPETLAINALDLELAGASLAGTGALEFDDSIPPMGPDMPGMAGNISLNMAGLGDLIQRLGSMGLFEPEILIGARAMLGVLARPGPEPDTLESELEFTPDGGVIANGMRLR
ncbi:hypothetical protein [Dinoroseobacter sp. S76]|uniref:hypothetical protein n=1 Tax=Dinoroseobacter sp. S76 TaxID=3415124 RepID=UPI003C79DF44